MLALRSNSEKSVKVNGQVMCILGALYNVYADVIGTWDEPKMGNFRVNFFEYLNTKLDCLSSNDELTSGYLEAVRGALAGSAETVCIQKSFLTTVYTKVCTILLASEDLKRFKVLIAALELIKQHAGILAICCDEISLFLSLSLSLFVYVCVDTQFRTDQGTHRAL